MEKKKNRNENSWWEIIKFMITASIILLPIRMYVINPFVVSGDSMFPTIHNKDYLIIDALSYRFHPPHRGDVIVFHPPNQDKKTYYIKRVIGLPGDTLKLEGTKIFLKNKTQLEWTEIEQPYIQNQTNENRIITIQDNEVFVLGDNRPRSSDSRIWGSVPFDNIKGRTLLRLYPLKDIGYTPGSHTYKVN